jgi:hypothetical protein
MYQAPVAAPCESTIPIQHANHLSTYGFQALQEQAREHANWKKEAGLAGNPTLTIRRWAATRYDAMHMRMMLEVLTPGVQDGGAM